MNVYYEAIIPKRVVPKWDNWFYYTLPLDIPREQVVCNFDYDIQVVISCFSVNRVRFVSNIPILQEQIAYQVLVLLCRAFL